MASTNPFSKFHTLNSRDILNHGETQRVEAGCAKLEAARTAPMQVNYKRIHSRKIPFQVLSQAIQNHNPASTFASFTAKMVTIWHALEHGTHCIRHV